MKTKNRAPQLGALALLSGLTLAACGGGSGGVSDPHTLTTSAASYTLSGSFTAASHTAVDSDRNDPAASRVSNDTLSAAQPVSAPLTLGGYANVAGAGHAGASQELGDTQDVFRTTLQAGMQISLHIATDTPSRDDLDLYLLAAEANGSLVDSALGTTRLETLTVPADGDYYVLVRAAKGAATYILSIGASSGNAAPSSAAGDLRLSDEFIPGDMIVKFKPELQRHASSVALDRIQALGLRTKAGHRGWTKLLGFGHDGRRHTLQVLGAGDEPAPEGVLLSEPQQDKLDTLLAIKALRAQPEVEYAEPNYLRQSFTTPNDPHYRKQWHYPAINLPQAWALTDGSRIGDPVLVAVADTGVLLNHPDLDGVLSAGYDFIRDADMARDGDGIDPDPADPGDKPEGGSSFHGTHVAGTIAARSNNGLGVAGVSWGAKLMPLRVLGKGGGSSYDVQQAMLYAAGLTNDSGTLPARRADIINLSLGGASPSKAEQEVFKKVRAAGVIVIAAAGNGGSSTPFYPAAYEGVVAVSALDLHNKPAWYTNYGSFIDVAAPGGDTSVDLDGDGYGDGVLSTAGKDSSGSIETIYRFANGTSMAAPHISGVAALMKAVAPDLSPEQFDALLANGALTRDLGDSGRDDYYGHGMIDAYQAVMAAYTPESASPEPLPPQLALEPGTLDFDTGTVVRLLRASNSGDGELSVSSVSDDADWLKLAPADVDEQGLGRYTVVVDRHGLAPGSYAATIRFESSANAVEVAVTMQVSEQSSAGDAGPHYLLLLDGATLEPVLEQRVSSSDGRYPISLTGLAAGSYFLAAGTDHDNDGYICDVGEACGVYGAVSLESSRDGVSFGTRFDQTLLPRRPAAGFARLPPPAKSLFQQGRWGALALSAALSRRAHSPFCARCSDW